MTGVVSHPNSESVPRTLLIAAVVALFCSALVSTAVYLLRPLQSAFAAVERNRAIVAAVGIDVGALSDRAVVGAFLDLDARVVELATGRFVDGMDAHGFDHWQPGVETVAIPEALDTAGLGARPALAPVYRRNGRWLLPIHGRGMWSTLYGYVLLEPDLNTLAGVSFHRHGETPGIGDRIQDPGWLSAWRGKRARDADGVLRIRVVEGARGAHEVDLISGASITSAAAGRTVAYWLGDSGYAPLLRRLRSEEGRP